MAFSAICPARAAPGLAVVELFTSQSCSDSPDADAIFGRLALENDPNLIALSCHTTYLNGGPWQDTLSQDFCNIRQGGYFSSLSLGAINTPQMIINGRFDTFGVNEKTVRAGIRMAQGMKAIVPIQLSLRPGFLDISMPDMRLERPATLWLFAYNKSSPVEITAGDNAGLKIDYANTVVYGSKLTPWDGTYANMSYPLATIPADGYAVIAQHSDFSDIIAAARIEMPRP
jgi:hypothetical protein